MRGSATECHGVPRSATECHGVPRNGHGVPRKGHGVPRACPERGTPAQTRTGVPEGPWTVSHSSAHVRPGAPRTSRRARHCAEYAPRSATLRSIAWHSLALPGTPRHSLALPGTPWHSQALPGTPWHSLALQRVPTFNTIWVCAQCAHSVRTRAGVCAQGRARCARLGAAAIQHSTPSTSANISQHLSTSLNTCQQVAKGPFNIQHPQHPNDVEDC